ncbi:MAG TPA: PhzF family phenazine biosynthesis protein [Acetobacteraceae bacterium]|nr:PhzF family phenazine biosynthesis protein [Acetobacteraceae bacterium]
MPSYDFVTLDVFTGRRFGGNPLAVFPDARGLSEGEMQALAAEFNYSETTFVLPPRDQANTARVRIFTPRAELPFAGHPNIGTAQVLAERGRDRDGLMVFEEIAGLVAVRVTREAGGGMLVSIDAPQSFTRGATLSAQDVAACAGLSAAEIRTAAHPPVVASVGTPFVIAEVTGAALTRAAPDPAAFQAMLARAPALRDQVGLHLYAREGAGLRARMFAPLAGVPEDPATGSANLALAALLLSLGEAAEMRADVVQGVEMGRPSLLHVAARRAADGAIRARVAGRCVPVLHGQATL